MSTLEKTPITLLNELCMQEGKTLRWEYIPQPTDPLPPFVCKVEAFDVEVFGTAQSKKQAKHEACAQLIAQLMQQQYFADKLSEKMATPSVRPKIPQRTAAVDGNDAVDILRNFCVQHEYPLPTYRIKQASGDPHRPIFTGECQLASIKCTGTASKKSIAKQLAFRAVLDIVQSFPQNEEQQQLATVTDQSDAESDQPTFQTYRELLKLGITPKVRHLCDRHMFFLDLPEDDRMEAHKMLADSNVTNEQKINLICNALKLKYDFRNDRKIFVLVSQHDCVVIGKTESDLYDNVINHFKIMLDFDEPTTN